MTAFRHPIFARVCNFLSEKGESAGAAEHRQELPGGLSGRVVELGAGNGLNFEHYPPATTEVVAVEPEPYLRDHAREAAAEARVSVQVTDGLGGSLPFGNASFDAGVASLVLCSVPHQQATLRDLARVIRPGGELRFSGHVRANDPKFARFQDAIDRVWPLFGGGCHPNRATAAVIESAGFVIERCRRFPFKPSLRCAPVAPHIIGLAHRPQTTG